MKHDSHNCPHVSLISFIYSIWCSKLDVNLYLNILRQKTCQVYALISSSQQKGVLLGQRAGLVPRAKLNYYDCLVFCN